MSDINSCPLLQFAKFVLITSGLRHFQLQWQGKCPVRILIQGYLFLSAFSCLTTFVAATNLTALAQTVPPLPHTTDPSRIERELQPPQVPRQEGEITVPRREDFTPPPGAERQKFLLKSLQIQGATVYTSKRLHQHYAEFLNRDISLSDLYEIARRITQLYRQDGYILSQAVVPEQTIRNGVARLQVIEGFIERVDFQGTPQSQLNRLKGFGNKIVASRPLNVRVLERYLLLANDLAGIRVRAVLSPGSSLGASLLTAKVVYDPIDSFIDFNNRGSDEVGPLRLQAGVFLNSLVGAGELLTLSGATNPGDTSELANAALELSVPIGYEGWRVSTSASYTGVRPGEELREFDINGATYSASLGVAYPLTRSRSSNLFLNGSFDYTNREVTAFAGSQTLSEDRLRVLRVGMNFDRADRHGVITGGIQVSHGIGGLGATTEGTTSRPVSRDAGSAAFTKLNLNLTRSQFLPADFTLELSGIAQITGDALLVSEQFGVGGDEFGRAFDPSEILGDSGYALRAELQRPFSYTVKSLGAMVTQPYIFYDYGQVYRKFPTSGENINDALSSIGLGVRHSFSKTLLLQTELAFPLIQTDRDSERDPELFFSLIGFF